MLVEMVKNGDFSGFPDLFKKVGANINQMSRNV